MQPITRRGLIALAAAAVASVHISPAQANTPAEPDYNTLSAEFRKGWEMGRDAGTAEDYEAGRSTRQFDRDLVNTESAIVAGAIFDFMGHLTTREKVIEVGSGEMVYGLMEAYEEWRAERSLNDRAPDIEHRNERLKV